MSVRDWLDAEPGPPEEDPEMGIDAGPWVDADAIFSPDKVYRYRLWRAWDESLPRCVFVMLNPSSAGASKLDPTARRCVTFARAWGCGSVELVNAFALVSTDPSALVCHPDPIGPDNDRHIRAAVTGADIVVAAWSCWASNGRRDFAVADLLRRAGVNLMCLGGVGLTGYPKHPLYLAGDTPLVPFPGVL